MTISQQANFGGGNGKASIALQGNNANVKGSKLGSYKAPTEEEIESIGQALGGVTQQWATTVPGFGSGGFAGLGGFAGPSPITGIDSIFKGLKFGSASSESKESDDKKDDEDSEVNDNSETKTSTKNDDCKDCQSTD